jgi:sulfite reductase alpha subunit-like flavoprotein
MLNVTPCFFLFGVRELRDVFYQDQLQEWSENFSFDYDIYCSRENSVLPEKHHQGRVTDYLKESFVLPSPP